MTRHTRRDLLRLTCCSAAGASLLAGLSKFGLVSALAQATTDYKALVCIFMFGGNDGNNMLVPIDSRYAGYQQARSILALPQAQLLPLQVNGSANYGLHPNMPEMQGYFNSQKNLAILANVGTLVQPTRISGSPLNSLAPPMPAGPAKWPTPSKARTTARLCFLRSSPSAAMPSFAPESPSNRSP